MKIRPHKKSEKRVKKDGYAVRLPNRDILNFKTQDDKSIFLSYYYSLREPLHILIEKSKIYAKRIRAGEFLNMGADPSIWTR